MIALTCLGNLGGTRPAPCTLRADPAIDRFLVDSLGFSTRDLGDVDRGRAVSRILPTESDRDIALAAVIRVHSTREAYVAHLRDPEQLVALRSARFGLIGDSASAADVSGISVDASEYRDLRKCKVNDCNFKLPASAMRQFSKGIDWNGRDAKAEVDSLIRLDVRRLVEQYRQTGSAAMMRYDDSHGTQSGETFAALLRDAPFVREHAPELYEYLLSYPAARPDSARDVLYWSEDRIPHLRPTFTLTDMVVYTPSCGAPLVARKQLYANHYFEGEFQLMGAFDAPQESAAPAIYLVTIRRYRFDNIPHIGFLNLGGRVRDQLASLARSELEKERQALEGKR